MVEVPPTFHFRAHRGCRHYGDNVPVWIRILPLAELGIRVEFPCHLGSQGGISRNGCDAGIGDGCFWAF